MKPVPLETLPLMRVHPRRPKVKLCRARSRHLPLTLSPLHVLPVFRLQGDNEANLMFRHWVNPP